MTSLEDLMRATSDVLRANEIENAREGGRNPRLVLASFDVVTTTLERLQTRHELCPHDADVVIAIDILRPFFEALRERAEMLFRVLH